MGYLLAEEFRSYFKHSSFWSHTVWFIGLSYLFIFAVPFFLAFVVDQFWVTSNIYYDQPFINFVGDHLLQCFNGDNEFVSTSVEMLDSMITAPTDASANQFLFKVSRVDNNADRKYEFFNIYTEIRSSAAGTNSMECSLYLIATFGLRGVLNLQMQSPLHIRLSRPSGTSNALHLVGDIDFIQKNPLESSKMMRNNYNYTVPVYPENQDYMGMYEFILDMNARNETLRARYKQTYDSTTDGANQLSANIFLRVPVLYPIQYVPTLRENLKRVWQYYIFLFIPTYWIISIIIDFTLRNNIFKNSVSNNIPKKLQNEIR